MKTACGVIKNQASNRQCGYCLTTARKPFLKCFPYLLSCFWQLLGVPNTTSNLFLKKERREYIFLAQNLTTTQMGNEDIKTIHIFAYWEDLFISL